MALEIISSRCFVEGQRYNDAAAGDAGCGKRLLQVFRTVELDLRDHQIHCIDSVVLGQAAQLCPVQLPFHPLELE